MKRLNNSFFYRDAPTVARELLGTYLTHEIDGCRLVAQITETEAYLGVGDRGSHSCSGVPTPRTQIQFGPGGVAYVYFIYGMYDMFNVVVSKPEDPQVVLVRAALPVEGHDEIARRRWGKPYQSLTPYQLKNLLNGPGKFCRGMGITRDHNGADLVKGSLYFCRGAAQTLPVGTGKRINIDYAGEDALLPLRFFIQT